MVMWSPFDPDRRVLPNGYVHVIGVSGSPRSARGISSRRLSPTSRTRCTTWVAINIVIAGLISRHHDWASLFKGFGEGRR
jgi:hypothetical protein